MGTRKLKGHRKSEGERRTLWEELQGLLEEILDLIICVYLVLILAIFPFYHEEGYSHIGTDKSAFFCRVGVETGKILAIPLVLCFAVKIVSFFVRGKDQHPRKIRIDLSPTDIFAIVYCMALFLSYIFTDYKKEALWGAQGWNMGLLPQLMLVCIYFLTSRFWKPRKGLLYIVIPVSGVVFLSGCMNRFGFYFLGPGFVDVKFISTIGNINWYCGYAVSVMFIGIVLYWMGEGASIWCRVFLIIYIAVGYISLILQGSDSGLVALTVVMLVMFCMSVRESGRMIAFWWEMTLLWGGCLMLFLLRHTVPGGINYVGTLAEVFISGPFSCILTFVSAAFLICLQVDRRRGKYREKLFCILAGVAVVTSVAVVLGLLILGTVNTLHPGVLGRLSDNPELTFNTAWGTYRGATWLAGWKCFAIQDVLHKSVGVGPDCMWSYISSGSFPELSAAVNAAFYGQRLTNAHNEWLTVLIDLGIIGLIGYAGMMICGIRDLLKKGQNNPAAVACGFCLLAYVVNGMFSFQQSMGVGTVFVVFGMGKAFLNEKSGVLTV